METSIFIISAIIIVSVVLSRYLVRKKVTATMMKVSSEPDKEVVQGDTPTTIKAAMPLTFKVITAQSELQEAQASRKVYTDQALKDFKYVFTYDLMAALGYLVLTLGEGFYIAIPFAFLSLMRYLAFKDQFKAYKSGIGRVFSPLKESFLEIAKPKWSFYLSLAAIFAALLKVAFNVSLGDYPWVLLGFLGAIAFHILLIQHLRKKLRKTPNLKLVVLRVFGLNDAALFTFEGLLTYWQFFGSFFTVVDPSFLKSTVRQRNQIIPLIALSFLVLAFLELILENSSVNKILVNYAVVVPLTVVAGYAYVKYSLREIDTRFIKNTDHLHAELLKLDTWPRNYNHTFKSMPTMCYDNTWKMAVSEFVEKADIIFMDLRGYTEERKGCEYEVDYLFNNAPLSKIVFLISANSLDAIQQLMHERWAYFEEESPNQTLQTPEIVIYESSRENNKDIQGILDVLLHTVRKSNVL
jgi:hypothetical protein